MANTNPTIVVDLKADVKKFVQEINDEISNVSDWGISESVKNELAEIKKFMRDFSKSTGDLSSRLNASDFKKFKDDVSKQLEQLGTKTENLEKIISGLGSSLNGKDTAQVNNSLQNIAQNMHSVQRAASDAVVQMQEISKVDLVSKSQIDELNQLVQTLNDTKKVLNKDGGKNYKFKSEVEAYEKLNELGQQYLDIQFRLMDYEESSDITDQKKWAGLSKQLGEVGIQIKDIIDSLAGSDVIGIDIWDKKSSEFGKSFEKVYQDIENELDDLQDQIVSTITTAQRQINNLTSKKEDQQIDIKVDVIPNIDAKAVKNEINDAVDDEVSIEVGVTPQVDNKKIEQEIENKIEQTAEIDIQPSNQSIENIGKKIGKSVSEQIVDGLKDNESQIKNVFVTALHAVGYTDKTKGSVNPKHSQTFYTPNEKASSTYNHGGDVWQTYLNTSKFFDWKGYGNAFSSLTFLGDGVEDASKKLIAVYNKVVEDFKKLESITSEDIKFTTKHGSITKIFDQMGFSFDVEDFSQVIKDKGLVKFLSNLVDSLDDNVQPFIATLIRHLQDYQNQLTNMPNESDNGKKYGSSISTDSYGHYLQKKVPGVYTGIKFSNIHDNKSGGYQGPIIDDYLLFNDYKDQVIGAEYKIKACEESFNQILDLYDDAIKSIASNTTLGKYQQTIVQLQKTITQKRKELQSNHSLSLDEQDELENSLKNDEKELDEVINAHHLLAEYSNNIGQILQKVSEEAKKNGFKGIGELFSKLNSGNFDSMSDDLKKLLQDSHIVSNDGTFNFKKLSGGFVNKGVYSNDLVTVIARDEYYSDKVDKLLPKLQAAAQEGIQVAQIIDKVVDSENGLLYEIQETTIGKNIAENEDYLQATDEQILKLYDDLKKLNELGLYIDVGGDNIMYDKDAGFSFIDLAYKHNASNKGYVAGSADEVVDKYFDHRLQSSVDNKFAEKIKQIVDGTPDYIFKNIDKDTVDVEELYEALEKLGNIMKSLYDSKNNEIINTDEFEKCEDYVDKIGEKLEQLGERKIDHIDFTSKLFSDDDTTYGDFVEDYAVSNSENIEEYTDNIRELIQEYQKYKALAFDEDNEPTFDHNFDKFEELHKKLSSMGYAFDESVGTWKPVLEEINHESEELLALTEEENTALHNLNDIDDLIEKWHILYDEVYDEDNEIGLDYYSDEISQMDEIAEKIRSLGYIFDSDVGTWVQKSTLAGDAIQECADDVRDLESLFEKLDKSTDEIDLVPQDDINNINRETESFAELPETAQKAADAKREFVDANKEVLESIVESIKGLDNEGNAFESINKLLNNIGGKNGDDKVTKLKSALSDIYDLLNKNVDDTSLIKTIENLAQQGTNLEHLATVLKATKNQINQTKKFIDDSGFEDATKFLSHNDAQIKQNAESYLLGKSDVDSIIGTKLSATKDGFVQIIALVKTLSGATREYTLQTADGMNLQEKAMDENTAAIAKQMKVYSQVQNYFDKLQAAGKNVTDNFFFDKDADRESQKVWQMLLDYAKKYKDEIGEIQNITMQTRQSSVTGNSLLESFSLIGKNGHLTVGREGETVASNQELLSVSKTVDKIKELISERKKYISLLNLESSQSTMTQQQIEDLDRLRSKYTEVENEVDNLNRILGDNDATKMFQELQGQYVDQFAQEINKFAESALKKINTALTSKSNQATDFVNEFKDEIITATENIEKMKEAIESHPADTPWDKDEIANINEMIQQVQGVINNMNNLHNVYATVGDVDKLLGKIAKDITENTAMSKQLNSRYTELQNRIKELRGDANATTDSLSKIDKVSFKKLTMEFQQLHTEMIQTEQTGDSFITKLAKAANSQTTQFLAQYFSLQDWIRYGQQAVQTVQELDYQLVDLRKTSKMTESELNEFYLSSNDIAKSLGTTTSQIISQGAAWSRLGYNTKDATESMAALSAQFAAISPGMSLEQATDGLVSTMKGFNIAVEDTERQIMDNVNRIGKSILPKHMVTYGAVYAA